MLPEPFGAWPSRAEAALGPSGPGRSAGDRDLRPTRGAASPRLTAVGVGGAGVNAVSRLLDLAVPGVECLAVDTSAQTLARVPAARAVTLDGVTAGLGTGGNVRLGAAAVWAAERELGR